ncbi:hypothetical protein H310_06697 [Aphanomyces invadans]|uniref:TRAF-type domain-containing protein n=1 Tax=Aphanomyces invadans TaxID=157072 RepID=A0A024U3S6_9STRA|nr:hypothetical protein H310_06697 [Aphanomyces invadans]ETW01071.1 hypothetical protein H310_06697 [Aphanomyces invadans]|eukprot:XP_008870069.1 hypothetical protein H310_06697 [Aphanomyces invadans]
MSLPTLQWSPSRIPSVKCKPIATTNATSEMEHMMLLMSTIQDIDRQRTLLLNKAQQRCASTSSLTSTKSNPRTRSIANFRLEQHRLSTPHWDRVFPEDVGLCSLCGQDILIRALQFHQEQECSHRVVRCNQPGCAATFQAYSRATHEARDCVVSQRNARWLELQAHGQLEVCCLDCESVITLRTTAAHFAADCIKRLVPCPRARLGCNRTDIPFDQLDAHDADDCIVGVRRRALLASAVTTNQLIPCDWCNQPVVKRHLLDHKEDECSMRERRCPNAHLGCREWVPVGDFEKHVKTVCCVTLERRALADQAKLKDGVMACRDCGTMVKQRHMAMHRSATCPARLVPCVNVIHGCKAQLRFRDRHIHEHVDVSPETRAALRFPSRSGHVRIQGGDDIQPPWCAEFWVWLHSKEDDVLFFMEEAIRWQERMDCMSLRLKEWREKQKQLQAARKQTVKTGREISDTTKTLEAEALSVGEGIAGCNSMLAEARARVKAFVSDALVIANSIADPLDRDSLDAAVRAQAQRLHPTWTPEELDVYGSVAKWSELVQSTKPDEDQNHAKWLAKRMQLLKAIESRQAEALTANPADPRELARFLKQAKKELERLDEKLATCVDIPLGLVQPSNGFHTLASSSTSGLHLIMASTGMPGVHSYEKRAKFNADLPRCQWIHVAFIATADAIRLFVNGAKASAAKGTFQLPVGWIGAEEKSFRGYLQEVRFWAQHRPDVATTMHDVLDPAPDLRGYWTLEEGLGDYVDDMAGQFPRSAAVNVEWVRYSSDMAQLLGDPPTASYRQRNMCKIVARRDFLAHKHHQRNGTAKCSLGCGQDVAIKFMEQHHKVDCPHRTTTCREPFCGHVIRASEQQAHDATCELRRLRESLAAEYYRKHELVQCPFGCGADIARKSLPKHRKTECANRLVVCDKCGRSFAQRHARHHDLHDCDAPQVVATKLMVARARTRQESRKQFANNRHKSAGGERSKLG